MPKENNYKMRKIPSNRTNRYFWHILSNDLFSMRFKFKFIIRLKWPKFENDVIFEGSIRKNQTITVRLSIF